jgi:hypothetical protein
MNTNYHERWGRRITSRPNDSKEPSGRVAARRDYELISEEIREISRSFVAKSPSLNRSRFEPLGHLKRSGLRLEIVEKTSGEHRSPRSVVPWPMAQASRRRRGSALTR